MKSVLAFFEELDPSQKYFLSRQQSKDEDIDANQWKTNASLGEKVGHYVKKFTSPLENAAKGISAKLTPRPIQSATVEKPKQQFSTADNTKVGDVGSSRLVYKTPQTSAQKSVVKASAPKPVIAPKPVETKPTTEPVISNEMLRKQQQQVQQAPPLVTPKPVISNEMLRKQQQQVQQAPQVPPLVTPKPEIKQAVGTGLFAKSTSNTSSFEDNKDVRPTGLLDKAAEIVKKVPKVDNMEKVMASLSGGNSNA